jgi:hypothetical protein
LAFGKLETPPLECSAKTDCTIINQLLACLEDMQRTILHMIALYMYYAKTPLGIFVDLKWTIVQSKMVIKYILHYE